MIYAMHAWWISLPPGFRLTIWIVVGVTLATGLYFLLYPARIRWLLCILFVAIYSLITWLPEWGARYDLAREQWLAQTCERQKASALQRAAEAPAAVDGFLDVTDYDKLLNDRFQRAGAQVERSYGGTRVIDTGAYLHHPIWHLLTGDSFNANARELLTHKGFSFVEFEMVPAGGDGGYSNAGSLDTHGWTGKRYRLYYLAPAGAGSCAASGESTHASAAPSIAGITRRRPLELDQPFCLVLQIAARPTSQYRLVADESTGWLTGHVALGAIVLPVWAYVRWERIRVIRTGDGTELGVYRGYNYPTEAQARYKCNSLPAVEKILTQVLVPHQRRTFLRDQGWYEGSAVQHYYEPLEAAVQEPM